MDKYYTNYQELKGKDASSKYVENWIKKQIREDASLEENSKEILLDYPVVYVHAWENDKESYSIYVGETICLSERLSEHIQSGHAKNKTTSIEMNGEVYCVENEDNDWHSDWIRKIKEGKAFSWFFSCTDMNKSMSLDLENSLVCLIKGLASNCPIVLETKATSVQYAYSNKEKRDELLESIWSTLCEFSEFRFPDFSKLDRDVLSRLPNLNLKGELQFAYIKPSKKNEVISKLEEKCAKNVLFLNYPMVYMYVWKENGKFKTYFGETDSLLNRTKQHLEGKEEWEKEWITSIDSEQAYLLVFGHPSFNKSMIKDIENRVILYTKFLKCTANLRHNEQRKYSNQNEMFSIFELIINELVSWQEQTGVTSEFLSLNDVQKKCIGLASPFYELTKEQTEVKDDIVSEIEKTLEEPSQNKKLIILYGGAGTGKTMLLSSLLFSLYTSEECKCDLLVNNQELAPTYQNMIEVWQLARSDGSIQEPIIYYASDYFNRDKCREVLLIDEGHLLNTTDHTGGAKEQLSHIMDKSQCTVLVFDPFQFIDHHKYWSGKFGFDNPEHISNSFKEYLNDSNIDILVYDLEKQLRMQCEEGTFSWITTLCKIGNQINSLKLEGGKVLLYTPETTIIVKDERGYCIGVEKSLKNFYTNLTKVKGKDQDTAGLATFDWVYNTNQYFDMKDNKFFYWHSTGDGKKKKDSNRNLTGISWYKRAEPGEVGSVHDIQGFDLNYAFVIIGPSIKYNPTRGNLKGKQGIQVYNKVHRTNHSPTFILNELRVLLTRGVKGIMIYAVDENLREELYKSLLEFKKSLE